MLEALKGLLKSSCHVCGETIEGKPVQEEVKVPGYTGRHRRAFCSQEHLDEWKSFVEEWEEENHKIPETNKGSACVNCMR
ncbi:MAG: hypothetical protein ACLFTQ_03875 [Candidatus Aenigmatarchaeota archaeon]